MSRYHRETNDYRRAAWMPSPNRQVTFDRLCEMAKAGMGYPQIAARLGTTANALRCYACRYGITMAELRGEDAA